MSLTKAAQAATTVELARLLRHGFAPLVTYPEAHGWLPESAHKETVEAIATVGSVLAVYVWSLIRERRSGSSQRRTDTADTGRDGGDPGAVSGLEGERSVESPRREEAGE
jgi:hypothetical protein